MLSTPSLSRLYFSFLFVVVFGGIGKLYALCPDGDIRLESQAEVDAFRTTYPNCSRILGSLTLEGIDISSFDSLAHLQSVEESFYLKFVDARGVDKLAALEKVGVLQLEVVFGLVNLRGFSSIDTIDGLSITDVRGLASLEGLEHIESMPNGIVADDNKSLVSLAGVDNLINLGEELRLRSNDTLQQILSLRNLDVSDQRLTVSILANAQLQSLNGLEGLHDFRGRMRLDSLPSLTTLDGLDNLESTSLLLSVTNCEALESLEGLERFKSSTELILAVLPQLVSLNALESIETISGNLILNNLPRVKQLFSFQNVSEIPGSLAIFELDSLTSLTGLENVELLGDLILGNNDRLQGLQALNDDLEIQNELNLTGNEELRICAVQPICKYLKEETPNRVITNNQVGCNTIVEVEELCGSLRTNERSLNTLDLFMIDETTFFIRDFSADMVDASVSIGDNVGRIVAQNPALRSPYISIPRGTTGIITIELTTFSNRFMKRLYIP